jgi:conjugal transfer/entry exclusion protein
MRRRVFAAVLVLFISAPAYAQFAVIDPANLAQAVLIAERTWDHWNELRRQFETIRRMAQGLGAVDAYRIPGIPASVHDIHRWAHGAAWLEGLNTGDPTGSEYAAVTLPLQAPGPELNQLSATGRRVFERQYATVEIADSVARLGGHQVAIIRNYYDRLQHALDALEGDVLNPRTEFHEMTAVLDQIAAGELVGRRQDTATNQLLSHALEQLLARSKRFRDTEAASINMQLATWRDSDAANRAFAAGVGDALRTWRQP